MNRFILFLLIFSIFNCTAQEKPEVKKVLQDAIIKEHLENCALKYNYTVNMFEWQECLDNGLKKDSTVAYLWQQKAMPLFKARKYEAGMIFLDKAVKYDRNNWLAYRAFIKCIFSKTYKEAIADFEECKKIFGNTYEMDHTYDFYIALSYLQLNEFKKAEEIFQRNFEEIKKSQGEDVFHHLDLFYYGISKYEQNKIEEAIVEFDKALEKYPQFSDVEFYKGVCLYKLGEKERGEALLKKAKHDNDEGFTINEDNVIYERYPYQIKK
jgi:tetratricopeptide (TPR) repeat protein